MNMPNRPDTVRTAIEISISLVLIFILLAWCLKILQPFVSLIAWGAIIAIALYGPFKKLQAAVGGNQKLAVVLFTLMGLATVLVPAWMFAGSIIDTATQVSTALETEEVSITPPSEKVKDWPLVGERVFAQWSAAAANFEGWLTANHATVKKVMGALFGKLAGIGLGVVQFLVSTLIAAAMLANADAIAVGIQRLFNRLFGDMGQEMVNLSRATVISITTGVLGIAFIQAFLGGLGMVIAGVPAAGVWALLILILGIAQLPPLLVLLPVILYVFSVESTTVATVFAVWSILVSFSDMVLKPLLLGRGVEAPMLVILLGAIGGMIMSGIIGLFLGAVVLAFGYTLMNVWLKMGNETEEQQSEAT